MAIETVGARGAASARESGAAVRSESPANDAPAPHGVVLQSGPGYAAQDRGPQSNLEAQLPDLVTPAAQRRGSARMKFSDSKLLELEGFGDLERARAMLAPMGLEPVPTPSGQARISIGSMRYKMAFGLFNPAEVWLAVVARPIGGGPVGHAYLHTVTDSRIMRAIGEGWGIPYERADITLRRGKGAQPEGVEIRDGHGRAMLDFSAPKGAWTQRHQEVDFPAYSPTGNRMEVHIEGKAAFRRFDPMGDEITFAEGSALGELQRKLGFAPVRWVSHDSASGAIRT